MDVTTNFGGRMSRKCQIQWIDAEGQVTPDTNDAIGVVQEVGHVHQTRRGPVSCPGSGPFYICAEHAKRLDEPGMEHWHLSPLPLEDGDGSSVPEVGATERTETARSPGPLDSVAEIKTLVAGDSSNLVEQNAKLRATVVQLVQLLEISERMLTAVADHHDNMQAIVQTVLDGHTSFCLDNPIERNQLARKLVEAIKVTK